MSTPKDTAKPTTGETYRFQARDAFVYVDTFRRLRLEQASVIEGQMQRLIEKYWNAAETPTKFYAELRAHEHALEYVMRHQEPNLVVIGDPAAAPKPAPEPQVDPAMLEAMANTLRDKDAQIEQMVAQMAGLNAEITKLQEDNREAHVDLSRKVEQIRRLRERLYQTNSSFMAVGAVLMLVVIVLLYMYLSRG